MAMQINANAIAGRRRAGAMLIFAGAALAVIGFHLATNGTLGFHTDELYYLDAGRHPALGYVDFPPIVPLLARLETGLLGISPWNLRLLPSLLGAFMAVLSGAYVRRLGGSLLFQALAVVIAATAPYFLGANWVYQTVTFDEATWMVALYWFLSIVIERRPRHWIFLGISLGVGLEVKYTIIALIVAMAIAILLTPSLRSNLRTRYPWIALGLALLIWLPNLVWQVAEGFPTVTYIANHAGAGGGFVSNLILIIAYLFFLLPIWIAGLVSLWRSSRVRPVAVACLIPLVLFLFVGKVYYAVGTVPLAIAQGLIAISRVRRHRLRVGFEAASVVAALLELVVLGQIFLPITPADQLHAKGLDTSNELFADSVGWDSIPGQVVTLYDRLPNLDRQNAIIISAYYGVPGAVWVYGY
jgi:4-amino-4-deoxy-L-arabinose transferase-like glycosyltransferase